MILIFLIVRLGGSPAAENKGSAFVEFGPAPTLFSTTVSLSISLIATGPGKIYYTTDGSVPTRASTLYSTPITINTSSRIRARAFLDGATEGGPTNTKNLIKFNAATMNNWKVEISLTIEGGEGLEA